MLKISSTKYQKKIDKCNEKYEELKDTGNKLTELHESTKDEKGHVTITTKNIEIMKQISDERYNFKKIKEELDNCINDLHPYNL